MRKIVSVLIFFLFLLLPAQVFASSQIVINEIYYDPLGSDSTLEFLELYNSGDADICIGRWDIQVAGTSFSTILTIPDNNLIKAKSYYLIAGQDNAGGFGVNADLTDSSLSVQNGGNETDGVRIRDIDNKIIDTILYDEPNTNNLPDDISSSGNSFTVDVNESHSLQRKNTGIDTDNSSDDFTDQTIASPEGGGKGSCPAEPTTSPQTPTSSHTPTPTPKSTSPSTTSSNKKSPSPTPQKNPIPSASPSSSPEVLGQRDLAQGFAELGATDIANSPSPSPSTYDNPFNKNVSKILIGAGILFIIVSSGVYLWYKRSLGLSATINKGNERFEEKEE